MAEGSLEGLKVELREGLMVWTLARPDRSNALSRELLRNLGALARSTRT